MGEIAFSRAGPPIFVHKIFLASLVAIPRPPIKTSRVEAAATFAAKLGQTGRKRERKRKRERESDGTTLVVHSKKRGDIRGNNIRRACICASYDGASH